ncbi:MAG TPA: dihydroxyacetone kinase subunit DhaL [Actinomycetota bacterium]|jgi:dihydroxyacetone kinase-like protein|nr:dihydroxyacetone kinase subunit DhaL [Actinomycetota bacterium]
MFSSEQAVDWVRRTAAVIGEHATELTKLDAAIGDGDHGTNMARGFRAVLERLDGLPEGANLGAVFKAVSMALIGKVGGASGPLYGSFYLAIGRELGDATEVEDGAFAAALRAGYDSVVARGKAQLEDKTMLDALHPALAALDAALADGKDLGAALDAAEAAAREGVAATIPLIARKGRASYLGERSRDHQDPGATSSHLILGVLADVVNGR